MIDAWLIGGVFVLMTLAYLYGKWRGLKKGWRNGYAEGWRRRERYGEGGRSRWLARQMNGGRNKGDPRHF